MRASKNEKKMITYDEFEKEYYPKDYEMRTTSEEERKKLYFSEIAQKIVSCAQHKTTRSSTKGRT